MQHLHSNSAGNIFTWNNSLCARIRSYAIEYSGPFTPRFLGQNGAKPGRMKWHTIMRIASYILVFSCNSDALAHFMLFPLFMLFSILTQIHALSMRAHFNQFSSIHCLFHHPIFYVHNLWQKNVLR